MCLHACSCSNCSLNGPIWLTVWWSHCCRRSITRTIADQTGPVTITRSMLWESLVCRRNPFQAKHCYRKGRVIDEGGRREGNTDRQTDTHTHLLRLPFVLDIDVHLPCRTTASKQNPKEENWKRSPALPCSKETRLTKK